MLSDRKLEIIIESVDKELGMLLERLADIILEKMSKNPEFQKLLESEAKEN